VGNRYSPTFLGIPLTSKPKKNLPTHGVVPANNNGLDSDSTYMAEQITTIDKSRMLYRRGRLTLDQIAEMDAALSISIGIAAMREGHFAPSSVY
jgi:mRNA interferase MazF